MEFSPRLSAHLLGSNAVSLSTWAKASSPPKKIKLSINYIRFGISPITDLENICQTPQLILSIQAYILPVHGSEEELASNSAPATKENKHPHISLYCNYADNEYKKKTISTLDS